MNRGLREDEFAFGQYAPARCWRRGTGGGWCWQVFVLKVAVARSRGLLGCQFNQPMEDSGCVFLRFDLVNPIVFDSENGGTSTVRYGYHVEKKIPDFARRSC